MFCIRHEKTLFLVFNTGAKLYDVHNINFYYDEHGNRINQTFTILFLQQFLLLGRDRWAVPGCRRKPSEATAQTLRYY